MSNKKKGHWLSRNHRGRKKSSQLKNRGLHREKKPISFPSGPGLKSGGAEKDSKKAEKKGVRFFARAKKKGKEKNTRRVCFLEMVLTLSSDDNSLRCLRREMVQRGRFP